MATMTACAIGNRLDATAQATGGPTANPPAPQQLPVRRFHIVAGPLDTALEAYRLQSGVTFKIALLPDQVATLQTPGLHQIRLRDSELFKRCLQRAIVEQGELHRVIGSQRSLEKFRRSSIGLGTFVSVARPDGFLAEMPPGRIRDRRETAIRRKSCAAAETQRGAGNQHKKCVSHTILVSSLRNRRSGRGNSADDEPVERHFEQRLVRRQRNPKVRKDRRVEGNRCRHDGRDTAAAAVMV